MTYAAALQLLLQHGPAALALGQKLAAAIAAGRGQQEVSAADWAELDRLSKLTSAEIIAATEKRTS